MGIGNEFRKIIVRGYVYGNAYTLEKGAAAVYSIKGYRRILRTLFNEAVRFEWITKNPVCATKIGSTNVCLRPVQEKEVFSIQEAKKFIHNLDGVGDIFVILSAESITFGGTRVKRSPIISAHCLGDPFDCAPERKALGRFAQDDTIGNSILVTVSS